MDGPITFRGIAESGILDGTELKTSGQLDLMLQLESDKPGSIN